MDEAKVGIARRRRRPQAATALLASVVILTLTGCERPAPPPAAHAEALAARARALEAEVTKVGRVSPDQQRAFDQLVADVEAYNAATRRFDVSVEQATVATPGGRPAYSARMIQTGDGECVPNCPIFPPNRPEGYFCLPDGDSYCDRTTGVTVCSYRCVKIPFADLFNSER